MKEFDVCVIGGGPGGYPAAIKAAQEGASVALVEKEFLGGTCLNWGCIPTKTLIANAEALHRIKNAEEFGIEVGSVAFDYSKMNDRKNRVVEKIRTSLTGLIASNKITLFKGHAAFSSPHEIKVSGETPERISAKNFIIATGSESRQLPSMPFDGKNILSSKEALSLSKLPKSIVIVGGGVIGCEFASLYHELGVSVTLLEALPHLLPLEATNISSELQSSFENRGIKVQTNVVVDNVTSSKAGAKVAIIGEKPIETEMVLVAVGRVANTEGLELGNAGLTTDKRGAITVNEKMETSVRGIYAIGDVTGEWWLAHVASHQGLVAAANATGGNAQMHYNAVPSVIFTKPEIGTVGMTLEKAIEAGLPATLGSFPFQALGKSQATFETEGFAQLVIHKHTGQILGAQVVGFEAATLVAEMGIAIANELTLECVTDTIHAHPTIAEVWLEAALSANDSPLHLPPKRKKPAHAK